MEEAVDEDRLGGVEKAAGLAGGDPRDPVDLGDDQLSSPHDDGDGPGTEGGVVDVGFDSPDVDRFPGTLGHLTELDEGPRRDGKARLLGELALGGGEEALAGLDLALDDRPCSGLLARPEGTAGMGDEHGERRHRPEGEDPGARRHGRHAIGGAPGDAGTGRDPSREGGRRVSFWDVTSPASATAPSAGRRFLPASVTGFVLGEHEPLGAALCRVTVEQFDGAIAELVGGTDVDEAIHDTRKAIKRLRAVLRLVRSPLGEDVYRFENGFLRDTAALIGGPRDAWVAVETIRSLRADFGEHLDTDTFAVFERALVDRYQQTLAGVVDGPAVIGEVVYRLRSARARYAAWPVDEAAAAAYGRRPIRHDFVSIGAGLGRTYARGRQAMESAMRVPRAEAFHEWRKDAKYLRHQAELIAPLWPEVLGGYARSLDRLGEALGAEHDLAVLLQLVAEDASLCPHPRERSLFIALAQHRRSELQTNALMLGARIYAEPERLFVRRLGAYWEAWDARPGVAGTSLE